MAADSSLLVGLHGHLHPSRWLLDAIDATDADAYSLIAQRSQMLGMSTFRGRPAPSVPPDPVHQWQLSEAGGDWTGREGVAQLIWAQARISQASFPLQAITAVLGDALARVGAAEISAAHAVTALGRLPAGSEGLAAGRDYLAFDGPDVRSELLVTVDTASGALARDRAVDALTSVTDLAGDLLTAGRVADDLGGPLWNHEPGLLLGVHRLTPAHRATFRVTVRAAWSVELVAWLIEAFAAAYRPKHQLKGTIFIGVSRMSGETLI